MLHISSKSYKQSAINSIQELIQQALGNPTMLIQIAEQIRSFNDPSVCQILNEMTANFPSGTNTLFQLGQAIGCPPEPVPQENPEQPQNVIPQEQTLV